MTTEFLPSGGPVGLDREVAGLPGPAGGSGRLGSGWRQNGVRGLGVEPASPRGSPTARCCGSRTPESDPLHDW